MRIPSSFLALAAGLLLAAPALAQSETAAPAEATPETKGGVTVSERAPLGDSDAYVASEHGDWQLRCLHAADGSDPCQLYQLVKDDKGNEVAEAVVLATTNDENISALVQLTAPLESLLPAGMSVAIDAAPAQRVPYLWCAVRGCIVRMQLATADLETFKKGNKVTVTMVPAAAPDKQVTATFSLSGFTAGFEALQKTQ